MKPARAETTKATGSAARSGTPMRLSRITATYPPSMAKAPCARLTKFMMPSVIDRPSASMNSNMPVATPSKRTVNIGRDPKRPAPRAGGYGFADPGRAGALFLRGRAVGLECAEVLELDVVELAVLALDLADIDVLGDVARLWVDADRSARAHPGKALGGGDEFVAFGGAVRLLQHFIDEVHAVIAADRHEVRPPVGIGLLEGADIGLVLRRIMRRRIDARGDHA